MSIIGVLRYLQSKSASECLSMKSGFFEDFHWNNLHRKFLLETFQWVWFKTSSFKSFINSVLFWVLFEFFSKIIVQLLIVTYYAIRIFKIQFWIPKLIAQKLSANLWTGKCSSSFVWLKFVSSTLFVSVDLFEVFWLKSFEIFPRSWVFEVETFSRSPRALEFQMKVLHSNQMANWIIWTIWIIRHVIPSC